MTKQTIAGIAIPDTPLVRDTTSYIRDVESDLLFDHSRRVFLFGALQGQLRGLDPDLELLYVGAMFHDIGLTADYRESKLRFEVDGANAAEKFLRDRGLDDATVRKVWLSIALHTTPGVPEFLDPEIALVTAGVETESSASVAPTCPTRCATRSPRPIHDRTSSVTSCRRSPTATDTAPAARSATSTPTSLRISTRHSPARTSSTSSSTTAGLNEASARIRARRHAVPPFEGVAEGRSVGVAQPL